MSYQDSALIFAQTDLSRWSASSYASWMARFAIECPDRAADKDEPDALFSLRQRLSVTFLRGHADFMIKAPGESALADYHYKARNTKLARRVRPAMVLRLCCYVDMLETMTAAATLTDIKRVNFIAALIAPSE